jgi:hypothetical protein
MAVRNPNLSKEIDSNEDRTLDSKEYSSTVDCGSGHFFCW